MLAPSLQGDEKITYHSEENKSAEQASVYSQTHSNPLRYLAYRDIPFLLAKYVHNKSALDYGSGTGYSAQFLCACGFDVTGVDVSQEMLNYARLLCRDISFHLLCDGCIPSPDETYDLVFSSLVLFEIGSEEGIIDYLKEARRVMKKDGVFIALTGSQDAYIHTKEWLNLKVDYPENRDLQSGHLVRSCLSDVGLEFTDFYWTESDYRSFFAGSGFELLEVHYPLGKSDEPYAWKDETHSSPYIIIVAKKKS